LLHEKIKEQNNIKKPNLLKNFGFEVKNPQKHKESGEKKLLVDIDKIVASTTTKI
jgi:hypothetical protein